jgi:hypothetical protein
VLTLPVEAVGSLRKEKTPPSAGANTPAERAPIRALATDGWCWSGRRLSLKVEGFRQPSPVGVETGRAVGLTELRIAAGGKEGQASYDYWGRKIVPVSQAAKRVV